MWVGLPFAGYALPWQEIYFIVFVTLLPFLISLDLHGHGETKGVKREDLWGRHCWISTSLGS
jgi:hypothetical protein